MLALILFIMSELNQYLIASDSLANQQSEIQTAYTWNSQTLSNVFSGRSIADAAITNAKIKDLTWDKAQGGTAVLGGLNNGNGVLTVRDEDDNLINTLDKDGLKIENGKIVIKNGSDKTVIDSKGLVSSAAFTTSTGSKTAGLNQLITSVDSYTDITDASFTLNLDRSKMVLILAKLTVYGSRANEGIGGDWTAFYNIDFFIDDEIRANAGIIDEAVLIGSDYSGASRIHSTEMHQLELLTAGTHTLKLKAQMNSYYNNNGRLVIYNYKFSYIILGT